MSPTLERTARPAQRGFSLIEVLVAMGLLAIGMSGIMALFSAAVAMQGEAIERMDVGVVTPAILAEVDEDLNARSKAGQAIQNGAEFPVPGNAAYRYRVRVDENPGDPDSQALLCKVVIVARSRGRERLYPLGRIWVTPRQSQDAVIRRLPGK